MTPEQLKASILQRAMEGKLVPQNPNDEPASELLKRIKAEKEKRIKEGKIKRDKNETEIFLGDDGLHYEKFADGTVKVFEKDIPEGWAITHFPEICALEKGSIKRGPFGSSITKAMFVPKGDDTYKVYEQGNAIRKTVEYGDYWLPKADYKRLEGFAVKAGDIIVSCAGTIGETFVIPKEAPDGVINQALLRLTLNHEVIDEQYFLLMFKSLVDTLKSNAVGSAVKNLASIKFLKYETPFLLPPIAEQQRIVSKVHEAFEKVELYGYWFNRLQKINNAFPEKLRKSILQYAMQGKLVPQDPNDEPVEVLLEKIRQEKQKLFEEGKLKKKDLQESIIYKGDDNSYYEKSGNSTSKINYELPKIPSTWCWSRLNASILSNIGLTFKPIDITSTGIPVLKANNIRNGRINYDEVTYVRQNTIIKETEWLSNGDVLMAVRSGSKSLVGKVAVIYDLAEPTTFGAFMSVIRPLIVDPEYLTIYFESPLFRNQLEEANTTTIYQVTQKMLKEAYYPIAPCQEQQRIIARVSQLNEKLSELVSKSLLIH